MEKAQMDPLPYLLYVTLIPVYIKKYLRHGPRKPFFLLFLYGRNSSQGSSFPQRPHPYDYVAFLIGSRLGFIATAHSKGKRILVKRLL
jgi:hypothetical protein